WKEYVTTDISTPLTSLYKGEKLRLKAPKGIRDDFFIKLRLEFIIVLI
ncbi:MAG: hypothetical protein HOC84_07715, partial [Flavobacteriaceae bacterium]|nr:hypothetical protein [Flavobacteriaceae bacterium]